MLCTKKPLSCKNVERFFLLFHMHGKLGPYWRTNKQGKEQEPRKGIWSCCSNRRDGDGWPEQWQPNDHTNLQYLQRWYEAPYISELLIFSLTVEPNDGPPFL